MLTGIGNVLGPSPVPTIVHCLARRDGTDEFYNLKVYLHVALPVWNVLA